MPANNIFQIRRGTSTQWNSTNPVLASGEPGYDLTNNIYKIGDGNSNWNNLKSILDITGNANISGVLTAISGNFNSSLYINNIPVSVSGHDHLSSNIIDFNSSVSGLLPVKDIISGSGISVSSSSGIYTINSTVTSVQEANSLVTTVFNKTGSAIPKMSVVYINGGQGDQPTISLAIANSESTSSKTYGVTQEAISDMSLGKVVVLGALTGLDTDQFNPTSPHGDINGTTLWLSPTVSGGLTRTKPYAPNHMVAVGTVVRTHQNEGVLEVRIQNGFELEELHNVATTGATNGQFLQYNASSGLWIPSSSGNFTNLNVNGTGVSVSGHTHTITDISNFNSGVSGLLPVTNIVGGTNISIISSGTSFTVSVSGSLGLTTEEVDDRVSSLLVAGTGISLSYNDNANTLTISTTKNTILSDVVSSTNYIGIAPTGTSTSSSSWKIKRTIYNTNGTISSTGVANNVAWTDRLTSSYS